MAKIKFNFSVPTLNAVKVEVRDMIIKAGKYAFKVLKAEMIDSRTNPDGSEKKRIPNYVDATPEVYMVIQDIVSKKTHVHRMALASFRKFNEFSQVDVKDNNISKDPRDGYALIADKEGNLHRIPATEGDGYEAVLNIFSRFVQAIGLEEGTTPADCATFVGGTFKGELKENHYTTTNEAGDDVEKDRLKLSPSFYPVSEEELEELEQLSTVAQAFN